MPKTMPEWGQFLKEMWQELDFERLRPYYADDVVYTAGGPVRGSRYEGKAAVLGAHATAVGQKFVINKVIVNDVILAEDWVILAIRDEGVSRVTGREYLNDLLYMYQIKDGKIVRQCEYLDTLSAARATGDVPYPDQVPWPPQK